jgi:hypothetical protein
MGPSVSFKTPPCQPFVFVFEGRIATFVSKGQIIWSVKVSVFCRLLGIISDFGLFSPFFNYSFQKMISLKIRKGGRLPPPPFWFAQRGESIRSAGRSRRHPDQGEDNPNCKGVAGNGRV